MGGFWRGKKNTLWSMEVTSGLSVRLREEVAEQRPEYPTSHRILELLTCVSSFVRNPWWAMPACRQISTYVSYVEIKIVHQKWTLRVKNVQKLTVDRHSRTLTVHPFCFHLFMEVLESHREAKPCVFGALCLCKRPQNLQICNFYLFL